MIEHNTLIKRLRALDYHFKNQTQRVEMYKKKGSTARIVVSKRDYHDETYARGILRSAGLDDATIERFIAEYRTNKH